MSSAISVTSWEAFVAGETHSNKWLLGFFENVYNYTYLICMHNYYSLRSESLRGVYSNETIQLGTEVISNKLKSTSSVREHNPVQHKLNKEMHAMTG